jgi:hypothetical protein
MELIADAQDDLLAVQWLRQKVIGSKDQGAVPRDVADVCGEHYHR